MKFKVGDTVRQIWSGSGTHPEDNNKTGIVMEVGGHYIRDNDGIHIKEIGTWKHIQQWRGEDAFELVEPVKITNWEEELK